MDNASKIREYLEITAKIEAMEKELPSKQAECEAKLRGNYERVKRELGGYLTKIKPTVDTVCGIYKSKVRPYGSKIALADGSVPEFEYNASNACDASMKLGNEAIKLLAMIVAKNNVDINLREFVKRYNTIVSIFSSMESLYVQAVKSTVSQYRNEISALDAKKHTLFSDRQAFNSAISKIKADGKDVYNRAIINDSMTLATDFATEINIPLGFEAVNGNMLGEGSGSILLSTLDWKLHKDGIAVIKADNDDIDKTELTTCLVNTTLQFLFAYPQLSKRVLICDSTSSNTITTFAGILKNGNTELFFGGNDGSYVKNNDEDIRSAIGELNRIINQRIMILGQSRCSSTLEYNKKNQDNPLPIILTVLSGYPFKYENVADELSGAFKNGQAAGVYFLVTENTYEDEDSCYYRKRLPKIESGCVAQFKQSGQRGYLLSQGKTYFSNTCGNNYSLSSVLSAFKVSVKSSAGKIVYLDSVVDKEDFASSPRRKKYSRVLSIPFGKQGSNPMSVELTASGPAAHLALIGIPGSGKTAFINSLVLSACKLYSPEELELHLIVMVKGDFRIFEEQKLPHLKTVVTGDRIFAANDILDFIDEEMKRRGELIGSYGNIYAYNEVAEKKLPRCVIIIDEFYQLVEGSDEAVDRINRIAQVGRAYGISLVISSIKFPIEVNSIIPLFGNRIEFKSNENSGQLIPEAARRQSELENAKGLCFFSSGESVNSVRVAYAEEGDKLISHITEVKNKYPNHKMDIQSEIKSVVVSREADIPFTVKRAKSNYDEEGIIRTRLGRTYLSNRSLEYAFDSKNNLLFLFGHYLSTKSMEASLIKDTLVLSRDIDEPTVYYIDFNRNASLRKQKTVIKKLQADWGDLGLGKVVYAMGDSAETAVDDIKDLIEARETDEDSEIYPVLVVIAKGDDVFSDNDDYEDLRDKILELVTKGKENNVYFAVQCNEPVAFYGSDKYITDAIIFPDRYSEDDEYTSNSLCAALEAMPAGSTDKGRKLLSNAALSPLHPKLHILCDNNKLTIFIPYDRSEDYLKG